MVVWFRDNTLLPCTAMSDLQEPSLADTDSTMSDTSLLPVRCSPTSIHPPPVNIRTSFKNFQSFASIVVGQPGSKTSPETAYTIHKDLLTAASPFFSAALNGAFAEGLDQTVRLPEEKPDIFEWFLYWLYTGSLTTPSTNCSALPTRSAAHPIHLTLHPAPPTLLPAHTDGDLRNAAGSPKYFLLLDLYALSDRLLTTPLSNHILDTMARLSEATNSVPTPSDTWILCDTIRDSAPVRRLVLDLFAYKKTDKLLESHRDEWHPRFLRDLVVKLKRPGFESLDRHGLVPWRPGSWPSTRACEGCSEVLKPGVSGERCEVCDRAFCGSCVRLGRVGSSGGEVGACKPWLRGACTRYHEHEGEEGKGCPR